MAEVEDKTSKSHLDDGSPLYSKGWQKYNHCADLQILTGFIVFEFGQAVGRGQNSQEYFLENLAAILIGFMTQMKMRRSLLTMTFNNPDQYCYNKNPTPTEIAQGSENRKKAFKYVLAKTAADYGASVLAFSAIYLENGFLENSMLCHLLLTLSDSVRHVKVQSHSWTTEEAPPAPIGDTDPSYKEKFLEAISHVFGGNKNPIPVPTQSVAALEQDLS